MKMGVDTRGRIIGRVTVEQIIDTIKELYNVEVVNDTKKIIYDNLKDIDFPFRNYGDAYFWWTESGFIEFTVNGEQRQLFYYYDNINTYENIDYYKENFPEREDLRTMVKSETTSISLGNWGLSVEIIEAIVKKFGGWIDENDCDEIPYRYVEREV